MNSIIDEVLTKDSTDVKLHDLDRSTDTANNAGDICENMKSTKSIFATEESKNMCPQEEEHINTPTTKVDKTIVKIEEYEETAAKKSKTIIDNDKNINPTINKECSESKYNKRDDIVKKEPEDQTMMLSNINLDREFVIINEENHKKGTGDKNRQSYDVSEPPSEEETEDFKEEVEDIAITGDQEIYEIIDPKANGTKAEDLTDDENKEQFISEKTLFEDVEDEKKFKIEATMYEKETSKNCDVDEKYEDSRDNKSFLNNDVLDLYDSSSKYSEEDETEFITLKEDELNTIHDLYKSTDKSTSINSNVFESLKSTERIVAAATEELKGVYPQEEEQISAAMTKIYETIVNIQENKEKAANNSKAIVDNVSDVRKRQHEEDEYIQDKSKTQKQQVKSDESSFIQSKATRSQRLTTSGKRFKRPTKAGINAPTQRIRLNVTTAATVTSIEQYRENNDVEDLLQATWIENDETQMSGDDDAKKQQQTQQQDHYSSSSSAISTSIYSERLHKRNREGIIIGDDDCNENNDNPSLVSALAFPKNVDSQMFINGKNKYRCVICNQYFNSLVYHYVNEHRGCEVYNSRLSPSQIKLVKQGRCDVTNGCLYKSTKHYEAFCIFCQENLRLLPRSWHQHFTRHTGEFAYRCTGCGFRKPIRAFREHQAQGCPKAGVIQEYFSLKIFPIEANVCNLCNYVQLHRSNIERHLHVQHNIKQILPKHLQTISLLSIPKFMTATSTGSKIYYRRWNKSDTAPSLRSSSKIDSRGWNNSDAAPSVPSHSHASNTCVINHDDNDDVVTFDKILPEESSPKRIPSTINNTFKEFASCHKTSRDLNKSGDSPSSHADKKPERIIIGDDYENYDNPSLVSALGWPKNVDPQMFINDKNKDRCVICNQNFVGSLVNHYVNEHRGCEIYSSRLSPSQIKLTKAGRCEATNVSVYKSRKYYEAICVFCKKNLRLISRYWYQHFARHTGEFAYRCTGCGLRKPMPDFREHHAQRCPKASVTQDYYFRLKSFQFEANVCTLCNYVQLDRTNIQRHLHMQHNIKQILPEHIQTIALLSIPSSITASSTGSKIDSRRWNKSNAAPPLPSSSHASHTYVNDDSGDDNDVTSDKILPEETPPLTDIPTVDKNTFKEFASCHKATKDFNNSDGASSVLLSSDAEKNQEGIIIGDDDENKDNLSLVSALDWPKNVDPQIFINAENKDRCVICNQDFIGRLVYHYVTEHRGCEIYNSRLSPSQIKLVEQGRCEISNVILYKKYKHYEAFCIFCQENLSFTLLYWCEHFTRRHTGEFAYRCTGCGLRKPRRHDFKKHQAQECTKAEVAQDYFRSSKCLPIEANVCTLCNYVQLHRSNIERHLHMQHNIEQISPEHMQTIALLSIDYRRWNKIDAALSLPPSSHVSNTEETPPETNPLTIKKRFEKFTNSDKATGDLTNSEGSPSLLLPSHTEKDQQGIIMGGDDEINENSSLVSTLDWPKNVDTQMYINNENRDRCVICNEDFVGRLLVHHYVNEHRGCEIYNSRLSRSQINLAKNGHCEVSNISQFKNMKYYEAFCIFCQKNLCFILQYWYDHFTRHTGEFAYRCTGCGLRKPRRTDVRKHQAQECLKARIAQDYFRSSKGGLPIEANVCTLCNYVQLHRSSIEKHLHVQHNVKEILTEHIHTIVLLSISSSTTATYTGGKIDSRRWNKSDAAPSLPSSSHDCNASVFDNDDNDDVVTFDKILPKESSSQTNPPTINNNKFEKSTNFCRATRHLTNVDGSTSLTLLSENASDTDVIDNVHNDNNVTFEKMVKEETSRQANPTINNTFKEYTNSHKVICSKIITLGE